jgi:hypothetical protein
MVKNLIITSGLLISALGVSFQARADLISTLPDAFVQLAVSASTPFREQSAPGKISVGQDGAFATASANLQPSPYAIVYASSDAGPVAQSYAHIHYRFAIVGDTSVQVPVFVSADGAVAVSNQSFASLVIYDDTTSLSILSASACQRDPPVNCGQFTRQPSFRVFESLMLLTRGSKT